MKPRKRVLSSSFCGYTYLKQKFFNNINIFENKFFILAVRAKTLYNTDEILHKQLKVKNNLRVYR